MWYDSNWNYRVKITVQSSQVDSNLTDFPVYVDLSDLPSDFFSNVDSNGDDIRVTQSDGETECPIEIVDIDTTAETGELYFKANSLSSSSNTGFYIYYGNSGASAYAIGDTYGRNNVYDSNYIRVFNGKDATTTTVLDSTGNSNGTKESSGNPTEVSTGGLGYGQNMDGGYINAGDILDSASEFTLEMVVSFDSYSNDMDLFTIGTHAGSNPLVSWRDESATDKYAILITDDNDDYSGVSYSNTSAPTDSTLTHIIFTFTGGGNVRMIIDGVEDSNSPFDFSSQQQVKSAGDLFIGNDQGGGTTKDLDGTVYMARISDSDRGVDYSTTVYNNLFNTSTFYNAGTQETESDWYNSNWDYRIKITVQSSQVDSNLSDFPVYVDLSDLPSDFHTNVKSDGSDIRITTSDGTTECPIELVDYDDSADTGELHFKASSLSSSSDTDFYIYYGNGSASDYSASATYGAENVWTEYEAVWHMDDDPSGTAPQLIDSTANDYDMTSNGSMTSGDLVTATVGKGIDFDGSNDYFSKTITNPYSGSSGEKFWISAIIDNLPANDDNSFLSFGQYFSFQAYQGNLIIVSSGDNSGVGATNTDVDDGATYHVVGYFNQANEYVIYKNGSEVVQENTTDTESGTTSLYLGEMQGTSRLMNGILDEVRWAKKDLGSAWADAENTNLKTPSTFYNVGTQETGSTDVSSEVAICASGSDTTFDTGNCVITGKDTTSDTNSCVVIGKDTVSAVSNCTVTGKDTASRTNGCMVLGGEEVSVTSNCAVVGKDTTHDSISCMIPGSDTGWVSPGTVVSDDSNLGTEVWSNPSNAETSDDTYSTTALGNANLSEYLWATNFGFSIPSGATINGIEIRIELYYSGENGDVRYQEIELIDSSSVLTTEDKGSSVDIPDTEQYDYYGGNSDLWGETWLASDINSSNFGVAFSVEGYGGMLAMTTTYVDHIQIKVHYTVSETVASDSANVGIDGQDTAFDASSCVARGKDTVSVTSNCEVFGGGTVSATSSCVTTGKDDTQHTKLVEITGQEDFTQDSLCEIYAQTTGEKDVNCTIRGKSAEGQEYSVEVTGALGDGQDNPLEIYGIDVDSFNVNAGIHGQDVLDSNKGLQVAGSITTGYASLIALHGVDTDFVSTPCEVTGSIGEGYDNLIELTGKQATGNDSACSTDGVDTNATNVLVETTGGVSVSWEQEMQVYGKNSTSSNHVIETTGKDDTDTDSDVIVAGSQVQSTSDGCAIIGQQEDSNDDLIKVRGKLTNFDKTLVEVTGKAVANAQAELELAAKDVAGQDVNLGIDGVFTEGRDRSIQITGINPNHDSMVQVIAEPIPPSTRNIVHQNVRGDLRANYSISSVKKTLLDDYEAKPVEVSNVPDYIAQQGAYEERITIASMNSYNDSTPAGVHVFGGIRAGVPIPLPYIKNTAKNGVTHSSEVVATLMLDTPQARYGANYGQMFGDKNYVAGTINFDAFGLAGRPAFNEWHSVEIESTYWQSGSSIAVFATYSPVLKAWGTNWSGASCPRVNQRLRNVSQDGFDIMFELDEGVSWIGSQPFAADPVSWVAIDVNEFKQNGLEAGYIQAQGIDDGWDYRSFDYTHGITPILLHQIQTYNDGDPCQSRVGALNEAGVTITCEEDQCSTSEQAHASETIAYLAYSGVSLEHTLPAVPGRYHQNSASMRVFNDKLVVTYDGFVSEYVSAPESIITYNFNNGTGTSLISVSDFIGDSPSEYSVSDVAFYDSGPTLHMFVGSWSEQSPYIADSQLVRWSSNNGTSWSGATALVSISGSTTRGGFYNLAPIDENTCYYDVGDIRCPSVGDVRCYLEAEAGWFTFNNFATGVSYELGYGSLGRHSAVAVDDKAGSIHLGVSRLNIVELDEQNVFTSRSIGDADQMGGFMFGNSYWGVPSQKGTRISFHYTDDGEKWRTQLLDPAAEEYDASVEEGYLITSYNLVGVGVSNRFYISYEGDQYEFEVYDIPGSTSITIDDKISQTEYDEERINLSLGNT